MKPGVSVRRRPVSATPQLDPETIALYQQQVRLARWLAVGFVLLFLFCFFVLLINPDRLIEMGLPGLATSIDQLDYLGHLARHGQPLVILGAFALFLLLAGYYWLLVCPSCRRFPVPSGSYDDGIPLRFRVSRCECCGVKLE